MDIFLDFRKFSISIVAAAAALAVIFSCSGNGGSSEGDSPEKALDRYYSELIAERLADNENAREGLADIVPALIGLEIKEKRKTGEGCILTFRLTLENRTGTERTETAKNKKAEMIKEGEHWRVKNITGI